MFSFKSHATESVRNYFDSKSNQKRDIAESWICSCVKEPVIVIFEVHSFIYSFVFLYYHSTSIYRVRSLFLRAENIENNMDSVPSLLEIFIVYYTKQELPRWHSGNKSASWCRSHKRCIFDPWVRKKIPGEGIATHSSILARKISWLEEAGGLQSMSHKKSYMNTKQTLSKQ